MAQPREAVPSFRDKNGLFDFARQFTGSLRGTMRGMVHCVRTLRLNAAG
jgi:hypothetical protein